jgi:UDP-N-acetyl-D-mannosaminuronate dehydrogenase
MNNPVVIVAGMGEVGLPLHSILRRTFECIGIDVEPTDVDRPCSVLHVCYPFQIPDFVGTTVAYIEKYRPELTVINSTVSVGTSRKVQERVETQVAYSPVRGKHARMEQEMIEKYRKFVAGCYPQGTELAAKHFAQAGFSIDRFTSTEMGELTKLLETTWLGVLIGWAQEIERMAAAYDGTYDEVNSFMKEISYLPSHVFPGKIGGHCVMPNIAILRELFSSQFLDAVVNANTLKELGVSSNKSVLAQKP